MQLVQATGMQSRIGGQAASVVSNLECSDNSVDGGIELVLERKFILAIAWRCRGVPIWKEDIKFCLSK